MKKILGIIKYDIKKITSSVVAIVTILGLCIVPCLYAWFNIFSNWAPYESEATSRITVAVANEDAGAELMGIKLNVGDKIISALEANGDIGWVFIDSGEEALEGVLAGDYYAALVIPSDFSENVMTFVSGELKNPQLAYYENEKKNAIAPKITGKAKNAVKEEVNATFIETLVKYLSEAASFANASGFDPQIVLSDLSGKMQDASDRLDNCIVMIDAAEGLTESADSLLSVSNKLIGDARSTLDAENELIGGLSGNIPDAGNHSTKPVASDVTTETDKINEVLDKLEDDINKASADIESHDSYIEKGLSESIRLLNERKQAADRLSKYLSSLGFTSLGDRFGEVSDKLSEMSDALSKLEKVEEEKWEERQTVLSDLLKDAEDTRTIVATIEEDAAGLRNDFETSLNNALANAEKAISTIQKSLEGTYGNLGSLSSKLSNYRKAIQQLEDSLGGTEEALRAMQTNFDLISEMFSKIAGSTALDEINGVLADDSEAVAEYMASPVKMDKEIIYPIGEYGSAMSPFYTVLAQWVGSLLTAVLIKVRIKDRSGLPRLHLHHRFFGRYGLYLLIGLAQALIVSLGDLLYVGIQCHHPVLFVLAACVNGITFMMINYALVFALDNIGLGAGVIILVLQVAGSGGTYPVEVLPNIFKVLYPVMPFRYAMDAMRECIGGMYGNTYVKCLGILGLFFLGAVAFGLLMYRPALWLNRLIAESKRKSEIML